MNKKKQTNKHLFIYYCLLFDFGQFTKSFFILKLIEPKKKIEGNK